MKRNKSGFTLVELLVVLTIIMILSGLLYGALQMARETARGMATKATIAKLNNIILRQYESYRTRRVGCVLPPAIDALSRNDPIRVAFESNWRQPRNSAQRRLDAIRDIMRMEMPERWPDVENMPVQFAWGSVGQPAKHILYRAIYNANPPGANYSHAKCLYMIVGMGNPEAMEQFHQSELAVDPEDGLRYFVDGWGKPIYFLRWAPGCSNTFSTGYSNIQSGDPINDHDPFDTRRIDSDAFALYPLIFSYGRSGSDNVNMGSVSYYGNPGATDWTEMDPFTPLVIGEPDDLSAAGNITNHSMDQR